MKNILIISYAYIAALIGAGFASGQEILCYFTVFGRKGFLGVIIAAVIFALYAYAVLRMAILTKSSVFDEFLVSLPGSFIAKLLKLLTGIFAFAAYTVMLAAIGEILNILFGIPQRCGALLAAIICALLFARGVTSVFRLNGIIGIILVVGIAVCCIYILQYREFHVFSQNIDIIGSACIYSGYNLLSAAPLLIVMSKSINSSSEAAAVSVISGGVLFFLMTLIYGILSIYANRISLGEFPMLTLAFRQNRIFGIFYGVMLAGAIVTTLLSSGGSMVEVLSLKNDIFIMLLSIISYAVSGFGFSRLVDTAYRICGITGFAAVIFIIIVCLKCKKQKI
ncbi:MAG: hypothetical protein ACI4DP_07025 [Candidatus Ornithomonoglobus sp.]